MDVNEILDKLKSISYIFEVDEIFKQNGLQVMEVENLITELDKYRLMCGEIEEYISNCEFTESIDIKGIKQKYFPKERPHFYECSSKDPHLKKVYFKEADNET